MGFMRSPNEKAGKGQKKRGEVARRGRLVEGVGVGGRGKSGQAFKVSGERWGRVGECRWLCPP